MLHISKVLYATDFSPHCTQAYFHAVQLASCHEASLTICHVYQPDPSIRRQVELMASERRHWKAQLEQIRPVDKGIDVRHVLLEGEPAEEILRLTDEIGADVIVMGTHGRSYIESESLGHVARLVLAEAPCSVLLSRLQNGTGRSKNTEKSALAH
ncbi:MAG: universal stress protein [Planctomycetota bacterium]|jgi:nucleotide-binding universal stress UspA family protein|nr:MAG: universal stress protein [Planctomycetota bacterium]